MKVVRVAQTVLTFNSNLEPTIKRSGYVPHFNILSGRVAPIDELHEAAGRGCYESWERPNPTTATNEGYLANIQEQRHFSVLEHGCVTYWIDGVSRNLLLELERHRHLSYSVVSTRYVDMSGRELLIPLEFAELPEEERERLTRKWIAAHAMTLDAYTDANRTLVANGSGLKAARGAARDILPGGISTTLFVTGNIRAWREIIEKRHNPHAARDIDELARLILVDLKTLCPNSMQDMEVASGR